MTYRKRRQLKQQRADNLMRICWFMTGVFFVATILIAFDLAATYDIIEAQDAERECKQMVLLFNATDGELGWPSCDHLLS